MATNQHTFSLDDVDIRDFGYVMEKGHSNLVLVQGRERKVSIPGRPGSLPFGDDPGEIPFEIPIVTVQNTPVDLQKKVRQLKSLFIDGNGRKRTVRLTFGYEPDKYYNVRYSSSVPIERLLARVGKLTLPLVCLEGFGLSVAKNDEITWGSTIIPFFSEYAFGHSGDGEKTFTAPGTTTITVTGDNIRPILHISGSGTNVSIRWGGNTFTLGTFTNANWIIDLGEFIVLKNGILALDQISGDWLTMKLIKGDNQININGSGLNLSFRAEYQDRYF